VLAELLVLLVLAGACTAILAMKVLTPVKSPADATHDYLEAIKTGNTAAAFGLLCRPSRKGLTPAKFAQGVAEERRTNGAVTRYRVVATFVESGGKARARYTLTTTKRVGTVEALLEKEGGDWKLCDFREVGPSTPN
jgi:hypothetical protein